MTPAPSRHPRVAPALLAALLAGAGIASTAAPVPAPAAARAGLHPPVTAACAALLGSQARPPILNLDPRPHAPRFFAIQFRDRLAYARTYATFATAIDCTMRRYVMPYLARGRPNVVVFDEDSGLITIATGSRAAAARRLIARGAPSCQGKPFPCMTLAALKALDRGYARAEAYYRRRFPRINPLGASFIAATDTFARGFMQTFSDVARNDHVYVIASNTQAPLAVSTRRADITALADPDLRRPRSVFVATQGRAYDQTFIWAPRDARRRGPSLLRNLVDTNRKVPLTGVETALGFAPGPAGGAPAISNIEPYRLPGTQARLGIATSLPAFRYGSPAPGRACEDVTQTYMRCLDQLGANVLVQPDANIGAWTGPDGDGIERWQPMSWMSSAWRAIADPSVRFLYAVNPMLTGNVADIQFDGQSAILQRGLAGRGCNYIGDSRFVPGEDRPDLLGDAGPKSQFLGLAPWVVPDAPRDQLRPVSAQLAAYSRSPRENDYVQTAVIADLPFPPDPNRMSCAGR